MAVLEAALVKAQLGDAQVVGIVGEAGVGKSRLCEEFARAVAGRGITVRRTAGASHAQAVPLLPVLEWFRDYFGISEVDDARTARERIAGRLVLLDPSFEDSLPLLFDFLEVPDPQRPPPHLAPEVRLLRIFDELRRLVQRRSEQKTLVVLLDDLHWFDPESDAFLSEWIALYPKTRTLVVANFRPDYQAPWMRHSYYHQVSLSALSPSATDELLVALLGADSSLPPLPAQIVDRTGGNPFYVEEIVRSLVEDGTLVGDPGAYRRTRPVADLRLPPTVEATLAARIDRLPDREKHVLQMASVIGRTFPEAVLAAVAGRSNEDLDAALRTLSEAEFLQQEAAWPVAEYRFWHPLTQEAAYGTLLSSRRQRLHAAVAGALAELDPARADERAPLIASHYHRAGDRLKTAHWEYRTAVWTSQRDISAAVGRLRGSLDLLDGLPAMEEAVRLGVMVRAQLLRNAPRLGSVDSDEIEALYREATDLAQGLGDPVLLSLLMFGRGASLFVAGEVADAAAAYLDAKQLALATPDAGLRAATSMTAGLSRLYAGPLRQALTHFDDALNAVVGDPDAGVRHAGWSPLVNAQHLGGMALALSGRIAEGRNQIEAGLRLARSRPEIETTAWSLSSLVHVFDLTGDHDDEEVLSHATQGERMSRDSGNFLSHVVALGALGLAEYLANRLDVAAAVFEQALGEARERQVGLFEEPMILARLASVRLKQGDYDAAREAADEAVEVARRQGACLPECFCLLTRAQVTRQAGGSETRPSALADVETALALAADVGAVTYEAFLKEETGRLRDDEAVLTATARCYRQIGAVGHARRLEAELSARPTR